MPTYSYTATTRKGDRTSGKQDAANEIELARILREEGYVLVSTQEQKTRGTFFSFSLSNPLKKVSLSEKLFFARNLQVMLSSGVSMTQAFEILAEQAESKEMKKALLAVRERVTKGEAMSEAIARHPSIFSELFINMVKVGEESGTLETVLGHLTKQLEREHELRSKVKGALLYPAVIVSAMTVIGMLMLILVVPRLATTFEDLGVELPLTTRIIIGFGSFVANQWYLAIGIITLILVSFYWAGKTHAGKRVLHKIFLHVPIIAPIVHKTNNAFTARTLSSLIAAGVPLVRSLQITSGVVGNLFYQNALKDAATKVEKGAKLSYVLQEYTHLYSTVTIQMIQVGEETGQSVEILGKLAEFYEEEVANFTKNLASIIEPVLMLVIGAAVGFFAISMVQPMYSLLSAF